MVCDSLAVCQCFRTWIALDVRMSRLVACVFGSTRRKQISGEFSPRSGIILSHFRSETFLKIGPSLVADAGSVVCARRLVNASNASARRTAKYLRANAEVSDSTIESCKMQQPGE